MPLDPYPTLSIEPPVVDPVDRLASALQGRHRVERELGKGGMATVTVIVGRALPGGDAEGQLAHPRP